MITPCRLSGLIVRLPGCRGDMTESLACPLMGLFGAEDNSPSLQDVARTEEELKRFNKTYGFHTYENAGHAFFSIDRPAYRAHAAIDGWQKVFAWFEKYLKSS